MAFGRLLEARPYRIYRSYNRFLKDREKGIKTTPPKRKKVRKYKSITYKQAGYRFLPDSKVRIGNHRKRTFKCEACSLEMDRDENAAINIRNEGLRILRNLSAG